MHLADTLAKPVVRSMSDLPGERAVGPHGAELVCKNLTGLFSNQRFSDWR